MKFCKDCEHGEKRGDGSMEWYSGCLRLGKMAPDPVNGYGRHIILSASRERAAPTLKEKLFGTNRCGPDGLYWTPIAPIEAGTGETKGLDPKGESGISSVTH